MRKFEIGDIVECVEVETLTHVKGLFIGDIYIIEDICENDLYIAVSHLQGILITHDTPNSHGWSPSEVIYPFHISRFILRQDLMRDNKLKQLLNEKI